MRVRYAIELLLNFRLQLLLTYYLVNISFNIHAGVFIACADPGMGRFDRSTLSQQSLMELFIFGLDRADTICGRRDDPVEVCH